MQMTVAAPTVNDSPLTAGRVWLEARRLGGAIFDQAAIALVNFAMSLLLIHYASPQQFGVFGLGYAALMLIAGISNALILTQMSVILPACAPERAPALRASFHRLQRLFVAIAASAALIGGVTWAFAAREHAPDPEFIMALVWAMTGWLQFEFGRRLNYIDRDVRGSLSASSALLAIMTVGLAIGWWVQPSYLHVVCLALLGCASWVAGWLRTPHMHTSGEAVSMRETWAEAWTGGRWALLGVLAAWVQTYGYAALLGAIEGTASVAEANAARLLVMPPMVAVAALTLATLPRLAMFYARGRHRDATRTAIAIYSALLAGVLVYLLLLWTWHDWLVAMVLHESYAGIEGVIATWGVVLAIMVLRSGLCALLQAQRRFRELTWAGILAASIGTFAGIALVPAFGPRGAVAAIVFSELALALGVLFFWRRGEKSRAH